MAKPKNKSSGQPQLLKTAIKKMRLSKTSPKDDLKYWLSKSPDERISAIEILRRQQYAGTSRLQ